MRIEAATLAGGEVNQDYYAYGDTYALVLDGASSFLPESTSIGADTYVKALGEALAGKLEFCALTEISEVVAASIDEVAGKYELAEDESPNSTVVIAKWSQKQIATYVLGDSSLLVVNTTDEITEIKDDRMSKIGEDVRKVYRENLAKGLGFGLDHKKSLQKLQNLQRQLRNSKGGYWIAGATPEAGLNGIFNLFSKENLGEIILATDGGLACLKNNEFIISNDINKFQLKQMLFQWHEVEKKDEKGIENPRSKVHDDKTVLVVKF